MASDILRRAADAMTAEADRLAKFTSPRPVAAIATRNAATFRALADLLTYEANGEDLGTFDASAEAIAVARAFLGETS